MLCNLIGRRPPNSKTLDTISKEIYLCQRYFIDLSLQSDQKIFKKYSSIKKLS